MFQSNIYYFMSMQVYIVSIEEIYGVLSLSMEFYLCLWSSIFVYGVLSLSTEFYLCMRLLGACIWKRLGACMRLLGASLTAADSLPDSR